MEQQLRVQKDTKIDIVMQVNGQVTIINDCTVFANDDNEDEVVVLVQDPSVADNKIQITMRKQLSTPPSGV